MKKFLLLVLSVVFLSGCATYKFQRGQPPNDKGYIASRDDYVIPEYTVGQNNTFPKIKLAKERFARRRNVVEDSYKKMGYIENHFKMAVWDPFEMFWRLVGGVFYMPILALKDYRYEHDPKYKAKIDKIEAEKDRQEAERIQKLKAQLSAYIQRDLEKHEKALPTQEKKPAPEPVAPPAEVVVPPAKVVAPPAKVVAPKEVIAPKKEVPPEAVKKELDKQEAIKAQEKPAQVKVAKPQEKPKKEPKPKPPKVKPQPKPKPPKIKPQPKVKPPKVKPAPQPKIIKEIKSVSGLEAAVGPKAVIIARPANGYSPLRVRFSGASSTAPRASRIVSYEWDFGDGDTSKKENPTNTFYSGESLPQYFTVTLTVQDDKGNTSTANATIEVLNR
jgi:hypothetical protein